jgi:hypothetical protein
MTGMPTTVAPVCLLMCHKDIGCGTANGHQRTLLHLHQPQRDSWSSSDGERLFIFEVQSLLNNLEFQASYLSLIGICNMISHYMN